MKNLLITGGCGFIGSNYINYIFNKYDDYNIINIDAMYYCASENNINEEVRISERYKLIKGNLCSYDLVYHIVNDYKIDYIIHFAAQSHVQNSFEDALQYTKDNIVGTHNLLEVVRKYGKIIKFIHVSTDEVYGESMIEQNENKKTEESILCPTNPYAATKASAELIAQSYYYSFNIPIIITRGNNVYGPNQYPEKIIPKFIKLLRENNKVTIQGDGSNVRAFIHVDDVVNAFDIILDKGIIGEIYNIGSDDNEEYTVKNVAEILIKKIKNTENYGDHIEYITDRPFNDKRYYISNQKIKNLGWNINENFDEGIDRLVKCYNDK
jgi:dTDP-glucose 4,6-dehydratase